MLGRLRILHESAEQIASAHCGGFGGVASRRRNRAWVRRSQVERAVRAPLVVMPYIDANDTVELVAAEDQEPVEALSSLPTQRSTCAFAFGARIGVRVTFIPSSWKMASKARLDFASRSWIRNRGRWLRSSRSISRLRACCIIQTPSGLLVQAMYSIRRVPHQGPRASHQCPQTLLARVSPAIRRGR
jgi:hypothetical protein